MITLWQAVLKINPKFCKQKNCDDKWAKIPTKEVIIQAIKLAVFQECIKEKLINKDVLSFYDKSILN